MISLSLLEAIFSVRLTRTCQYLQVVGTVVKRMYHNAWFVSSNPNGFYAQISGGDCCIHCTRCPKQ